MSNLEVVASVAVLYIVSMLCLMVSRFCLLWRGLPWTILAAFWMTMAIMLCLMGTLIIIQEGW